MRSWPKKHIRFSIAPTFAASISGHSSFVSRVASSPDGKRLAAGSWDRTVHVYALELRELLNLGRKRATSTLGADECQRYFRSEACPPLP